MKEYQNIYNFQIFYTHLNLIQSQQKSDLRLRYVKTTVTTLPTTVTGYTAILGYLISDLSYFFNK